MASKNEPPALPSLVAGLLKAEAFDHPTEGIRLAETHISWVILTGPFAYKLKKPVKFDFVDYSTFELREFYCREELRLNLRFAPDLYLGVVPISGSVESPKVGGAGTVISHAVKMRQFSEDALLSHLIESDRLLPSHIDRLAAEVADFHANVDTAPPASPFGTLAAIAGPVRENFKTLLDCGLPPGHGDEIRRLSDWSENEILRRADFFESRLRDGFVRECHGDLHLRNMLLDKNGDVTLFDGIEFNESFRWIDVINEVAFTTMDLDDRGRPDLAHRLIDAYLGHTGDYAGLAGARFYTVYRAMVRAKVAALRLVQERKSGAQIEPGLVEEISTYFKLAVRAIDPACAPVLVITHGLSGSGKSTGTQYLVDTLGYIRIRSDVERKRIFGLSPLERSDLEPGSNIYTEDATEKTYRRIATLVETVLAAGYPVVVDAAFLKREQRLMFSELAVRLGIPFRILHFELPETELRRRVEDRQRRATDASEATVEVLGRQLQNLEMLEADELPREIRVGPNSDIPSALGVSLELQERFSKTFRH